MSHLQKPWTPSCSEIVQEIYLAAKLLGADSGLLSAIGSWRDTMDDEGTLESIKAWNSDERQRLDWIIKQYQEHGCWLAHAHWIRSRHRHANDAAT